MKLSVFVVTYNQEQYIRQALDSILMQQVNFDYEIIIGEDCSTDSTPAICDEYAAKYSQIHLYHHNPNKGLIGNWEFVLNHCTGQYIAMLEGDDFWTDPHKLQKQVDFLDVHPDVALTFTSANVLCEDGDTSDVHLFDHLQEKYYTDNDIYAQWSILSSTVVFRNSPALPIKYPKELCINDTYTFLSIMKYGKAYCFTEKWTTYRRHASNITKQNSREMSVRLANQHRYMGHAFPNVRGHAQRSEKTYLYELCFDKSQKDTWKYRMRYIWLDKRLLFSRFALSTIKYLFV